MVLDLIIKVEQVPVEGQRLAGALSAEELQARLDAQGPSGFQVTGEAAVDLQISRIDPALRVAGHVQASLVGACARCLSETHSQLDAALDMTLFPAPADADEAPGKNELALDSRTDDDDGTTSSGYFHGDSIDAGEILCELLLLELPMRPLCREDCAGLCDLCGQNLNDGPCQCVRDSVDPRWSGLKDIKLP